MPKDGQKDPEEPWTHEVRRPTFVYTTSHHRLISETKKLYCVHLKALNSFSTSAAEVFSRLLRHADYRQAPVSVASRLCGVLCLHFILFGAHECAAELALRATTTWTLSTCFADPSPKSLGRRVQENRQLKASITRFWRRNGETAKLDWRKIAKARPRSQLHGLQPEVNSVTPDSTDLVTCVTKTCAPAFLRTTTSTPPMKATHRLSKRDDLRKEG